MKETEQFFTKSEYDFIGVEFNYEALAKLTSPTFAERIKFDTKYSRCSYIKKMHRNGSFYYFYAEDMDQTTNKLLAAYCNEDGDYFTVETIDSSVLSEMGLKLVKEDYK